MGFDPATINLNINEFHFHLHSSAQPGAADILNLIRETKEAIMTELSAGLATLTSDNQALADEVDVLISEFKNLPTNNTAALQAALEAANVDAAQAVTIIAASDAVVKEAHDRIVAALTPSTPVPVPATDLIVSTADINDAVTGEAYNRGLIISNGVTPYSVQVNDPATVNGLTMDDGGTITGTSTADGSVSFSGTVADSSTPNQHVPFTVSFNSAPSVQTA